MSSTSSKGHIVPVKSPGGITEKLAHITSVPREVRSRRKRWLEQHPEYFDSASTDLELSDPLAYDRLIRQHQTAAERESEGRKRGWAGTLETSLLRSEARLAKADPTNPKYHGTLNLNKQSEGSGQAQRKGPSIDWTVPRIDSEDELEYDSASKDKEAQTTAANMTSQPKTDLTSRRLGQEKWHDLLSQRFIDGYDDNFDYKKIDDDDTLDEEWVGQRSQETWFEEEEEQLESHERETGVQDF